MTTPVLERLLADAVAQDQRIHAARRAEGEAVALRDEALALAKASGASYGDLAVALGQPRPTVITAVRRGMRRVGERALTSAIDTARRSDPRPEKQRLFEQHREIAREVVRDPERALRIATDRLPQVREKVQGDIGMAWMDTWAYALEQGPEAVVALALQDDDFGDSMRQVTPFIGVITPQARAEALERARATR